MTTTAKKPAQAELEFPTPPARKLSYRQELDAEAMRDGDVHFHPRTCRDIITKTIRAADDWVTFSDICDATNMDTKLVSLAIDWMDRRGKIEKTPLYFQMGDLALVTVERHKRPEGDAYMGFEFGYQLPAKGAK